MWEDLEEVWNYDLVVREQISHRDERDSRYESLFPYSYPTPYPLSHTPYEMPSLRRLARRWVSGWY